MPRPSSGEIGKIPDFVRRINNFDDLNYVADEVIEILRTNPGGNGASMASMMKTKYMFLVEEEKRAKSQAVESMSDAQLLDQVPVLLGEKLSANDLRVMSLKLEQMAEEKECQPDKKTIKPKRVVGKRKTQEPTLDLDDLDLSLASFDDTSMDKIL
jgi:hypothetical protein